MLFGRPRLLLPKLASMKKSEMEKNDRLIISGDGAFYSLQGEGVNMGLPAVFLRLHLCNLKCVWCDTWYTWNRKTDEFRNESKKWTIEETVRKIKQTWKCQNKLVKKRLVITGGEPLLQQDGLVKVLKKLPEWNVEIETNGTIKPEKELTSRCQFNCSPKTNNSLNRKSARVKPKVINALKSVDTFFKFVVVEAKDIEEIERDYIKPFMLDPNRVIIMPQGVTKEEVRINALKMVDFVKSRGYRILLRLHLDLWGAERGV